MASAEPSRRVEKVGGYPPLCDTGADQRREVRVPLLDADAFEDLPGKWQAAIVRAEHSILPRVLPNRRRDPWHRGELSA
jgi:hypothetical protein